jgi:hypothetical protein
MEWLNQNSTRAYPLQDVRPRTLQLPSTATFPLDDAAITDFRGCAGLNAHWQPGISAAVLNSIARSSDGTTLTFNIGALNASGLTGHTLSFVVPVTTLEHVHFFAESVLVSGDVPGLPVAGSCGDNLHFEGILIIGSLASLVSNIAAGLTATATPAPIPFELSLVDDLGDSYVRSLNLANLEHWPAVVAPACGTNVPLDYLGATISTATCMVGDLLLLPGSNLDTTQDPDTGVITMTGRPGGGAGYPCSPDPRYPGEPTDAYTCTNYITSINGLAGPSITIKAGLGVTLATPPPTMDNTGTGGPTTPANTVVVNFNGQGLAGGC